MPTKIVSLFLASLMTSAAWGQGSTNTMTANTESSSRTGFAIALSYANLTNAAYTAEIKTPSGTRTIDGGAHLSGVSVAGLRAAYQFRIGDTMSIEPGLSWMKNMNEVEANDRATFTTLDGNFNWNFMSRLGLYGGLSVTQADMYTSPTDTKVTPGLGGQFGLSYQDGAFMVKAGYAEYGVMTKMDYADGYSSEMTIRFGGFNAQAGYMF